MKTARDYLDAIETAAEEFIAIADMDEWEAFWEANIDAMDMDRDTAFNLACNCCLVIGGGAAPLFRVGFVDCRLPREELTAEGVQYALPGIAKADNGGLF